jgi:hypothetical protein
LEITQREKEGRKRKRKRERKREKKRERQLPQTVSSLGLMRPLVP